MARLKTDQNQISNISSIPALNQTNQVTLPHEYSPHHRHQPPSYQNTNQPPPYQPEQLTQNMHGPASFKQGIPLAPGQSRHINVNPTQHQKPEGRIDNQMPEIRKYKKKFNSDINSAVRI